MIQTRRIAVFATMFSLFGPSLALANNNPTPVAFDISNILQMIIDALHLNFSRSDITEITEEARDGKRTITITENLTDSNEDVSAIQDDEYNINLTGYWYKGTLHHTALMAKVKVSTDLEHYWDIYHLVHESLSTSQSEEDSYRVWNDLISSTANLTSPSISAANSRGSFYHIFIDVTDKAQPDGIIAGQTTLHLDGKQIQLAQIRIFDADRLYENGVLLAALNHELGHALGLGHSNYSGSVMYPQLLVIGDTVVGTISKCEEQGLMIAYGNFAESADCMIESDDGDDHN